jgi:uncharacterized membrane protein
MSPVLTIVLLWMGFAGSHLLLSSMPVRQRLIGRVGEDAFRGVYSLVAFTFFVPLVWVYFANKHAGPALWVVPVGPALRWAIYAGMALAFVLIVGSFVQASPANIVPGQATPRGLLRITRHPLLMGLAVFGLVHLVPNGHAADVAFFAGFVVFPFIGAWHQDQRKLATVPEYRAFYEQTSLVPFLGMQTLRGFREMPLRIVAAAALITITLRWFHGSLFGG